MDESDALGKIHELLLQALRSREEEIFKYLSILASAIGGFGWLVYVTVWPKNEALPAGPNYRGLTPRTPDQVAFFVAGSMAVLLLLLLGAAYSLTLGYNYRYITLQLAKIESRLNITRDMLRGWPKRPSAFEERVYCLPPAVIAVFWASFVSGIVLIGAAAMYFEPGCHARVLVVGTGTISFAVAVLLPFYFGMKLRRLARKEKIAENKGEWNPIGP
jgi:hypothetical protein